MILKITFTLSLLFLGISSFSQSNSAEEIAERIANRMKDTLALNTVQRDQVYAVNMQLHQQKMTVRQQYQSTDSVRIYLQRVENTRDSLYQPILLTDKYQLYLQKKQQLIKNN